MGRSVRSWLYRFHLYQTDFGRYDGCGHFGSKVFGSSFTAWEMKKNIGEVGEIYEVVKLATYRTELNHSDPAQ